MSSTFRLLTKDDVRRLLTGDDLVAMMEEALGAFSDRAVVQPIRTTLLVGPERAVLSLMPAHLPARAALGSKIVTVFNGNHARDLPSHFATILLFDDATGELNAVMDGSHITEVRTAAVSAAAVRHLARTPARRVAIFGCGVQARSHLIALSAEVPTLADVRIWSPMGDGPAFVAATAGTVPVSISLASSGEAAACDADVILLVTSSSTPVVEREWVAPGTLVISVGACRPDHREMDPRLVADARLFVDSRAAALVESGDIVSGIAEGRFTEGHIRGELGDVVRRRVTPREADTDIVVFKSLGLAVEDVTVADRVYRRAVAEHVGVELAL
jgi:alanine dehydrogenase